MMATTKRWGKDFNLTITRAFVVSSRTSTPPPSPKPPTNLKNIDMMHRPRIILLIKIKQYSGDDTNK
jgi:hypothetical protein